MPTLVRLLPERNLHDPPTDKLLFLFNFDGDDGRKRERDARETETRDRQTHIDSDRTGKNRSYTKIEIV